MKNNVVLIISGYNNRGIVAFCRFFLQNNIPFFIVSSGKYDLINLTKYKNNIIFERVDNTLSIPDFIKYGDIIHSKLKIDKTVVLPSTEFLNRFLLSNKQKLENYGFIIPLVNEDLYSEISDKYSFSKLCQSNGIKTPKEYKRDTIKNIPFVAKPKQYFVHGKIVNQKPLIIEKKEDYTKLKRLKKEFDFYYQEFIGGNSFYLLFYFSKNRDYSIYSQQNLIQQDNGLSIIGAKSSNFHMNIISRKFAQIFIKKRYFGFLMIEVKAFNNKIYMIEANPRIWGPSQLILDSGMDLIQKFSEDFNLMDINTKAITYKTGVKYFWSGGIIEDQQKGVEAAFHNYNKGSFFDEYQQWIQNDIYLRNDTIKVYLKENTKNKNAPGRN